MKKLIPIVLLVLAGVGVFIYVKGGQVKMTDESMPVKTEEKSYTFSALKAAVNLGVPLKCTYQVEGATYEGYVKGKQWRGTMSMADGKTGEVIVKDNCSWSWQQGDTQGSKICFDPSQVEDGENTGDVWEQGENQKSSVEYHCAPEVVADDKFIPPTDVQFADMNQMMNQMQGQMEDVMKQIPQVEP